MTPRKRDWRLHLSDEERTVLNDLLEESIETTDRWAAVTSLCRELDRLAELGDADADHILTYVQLQGMYDEQTDYLRKDREAWVMPDTGQVINVRSRVSVGVHDADGNLTGARQAPLWRKMSWDAYEAWVEQYATMTETMVQTTVFHRYVQSLRVKYPETLTPEEACRLDGLNPVDLDAGMV